jgi:ABC-type polysaccharide/polyol phosphate transport system ATPase subunit
MPTSPIVFDSVWKKFERGERHDSLRDLIPALVRRMTASARERALGDEEFWALADVSFDVPRGEALGIIGRNGAGKSTVLKLLNRILKPTRGSARVTGRSGALIEVAAGFHPDLTGRENVYLQGAIMGMRRAEIAGRFDEIVAFAGVERFIDTPVKRYSSGMSARLGFSIAAHLNPDVLLIDEVLAVGDLGFQEKCHARMKQFRRDGVAIVFVSHHLPAVAQLCSTVLLLDSGRAARLGSPSEVIAEYCGGVRATSSEDQVAVSASLRRRGAFAATGSSFEVEPGARLLLDVSLTFNVDVERAKIGVVVWDVTRELYVYGASSEFVGIPPIRAAAGETRTFGFSLDANLTRGLYAVEVNVVDADRQLFLAVVRGIRHFHVVEQVSYDGVANLYLAGHEVDAAAVHGAPTAAAR